MIYPIRVGILSIGKTDGTIWCVYNLLEESDIINTELGAHQIALLDLDFHL